MCIDLSARLLCTLCQWNIRWHLSRQDDGRRVRGPGTSNSQVDEAARQGVSHFDGSDFRLDETGGSVRLRR